MDSFIPWIGGKSQLRKVILEHFHQDEIGRYVEVFGGAGWILFSKERHAPIEIFNDIDGHLINLYRCVQYHCDELQRELRMGGEQILINSRELFSDFLGQLNTRGLTDIQRAARYYYLIRASYGANREHFSCSTKNLNLSLDRLPEIQKRLQRVVIENRDFEMLIKTYNRPDTLYYLDPPYFNAECYDGFSSEDHERLFRCIQTIRGRLILSYNNVPKIRELYKDYKIIEVERSNVLAHKKGYSSAYKELIIKNYS